MISKTEAVNFLPMLFRSIRKSTGNSGYWKFGKCMLKQGIGAMPGKQVLKNQLLDIMTMGSLTIVPENLSMVKYSLLV